MSKFSQFSNESKKKIVSETDLAKIKDIKLCNNLLIKYSYQGFKSYFLLEVIYSNGIKLKHYTYELIFEM